MTTSNDPFLEPDYRVLKPDAFEFVFGNELKRAVRSQNYLTLVLVEPMVRALPGASGEERDTAVRDVAAVVSREVRETDLLAQTAHGRLSVVLLDSDLPGALGVIDRLMTRLEHYEFQRPLAFEIGAACCPTHGADPESLKRAAEAHPLRQRGQQFNAQ